MRRALISAAVIAAAFAPAAAAATPSDYAIIARDVVPSGAQGTPAPRTRTPRPALYDGLTPLFNHVSAAQVNQFFKPETLGTATPGPTTTETPKAGRDDRPRRLPRRPHPRHHAG